MTVSELIKELRVKALGGEVENPKELFELYKIAHNSNCYRAAREFRVGNRIRFEGKKIGPNSGTFEGVITQINQKTLSIKADIHNGKPLAFPQRWKISARCATLIGNGLQKLAQLVNTEDRGTNTALNCPYCNKKCSSASGLTLHKKSCKRRDT